MVTIPGASGFLNAATLANKQGIPAGQATVLGDGGIGGVDILEAGRANAPDNGIGLSSTARFLNKQFLESTTTTFNAIFSLGLGATASVEGLQQQILALRASLPDSQLAPSLREVVVNEDGEILNDASIDDGSVAPAETGQEVDTEA